MDIVLALILLIIFLIVLDQCSHMTITNVLKISDVTGLRKTTVGFFLLAFSTSLPELSVAFIASLRSDAALSAGNVIGSNIVNICLIVGLAALLVDLKRSSNTSMVPSFAKEDLGGLYFGLFVASIIPLSLVYLVSANWVVGLLLILVFVFYIFQSFMRIKLPSEEIVNVSEQTRREFRLYAALTVLGVVGIAISAYFIIESAVTLAESVGMSKTLIGATVIAFGTSLPKFFIDVKAFRRGHSALAFGDIVGSSFLNMTLILGITLLLPAMIGSALTMNIQVFQNLVVFSLIANLFLWYFLSMGRLGWREGAILIFIYVLFLATSFGAISLRVQPTQV
jgi:cation:H+ antiporter